MLNFIGIGSAFNTDLGNTCAYFKIRNDLFLIDCGSTAFKQLVDLKILNNVTNIFIAITHTHPDHVGSLGEFALYSYYILGKKLKIIFPDIPLITSFFDCQGIRKHYYEISDNLKVTKDVELFFFPASHVDTIPCYSIYIKGNNKSIFYSGDSNSVSSFAIKGLQNGDIDLMYQDTCSLDYPGNPHLYIGNLALAIYPKLRHKIYCMHIDKDFDTLYAKKLGFNVVSLVK
ncbi:MBL fold metallo-hydrolase [Herbivorax sp. ANBcel31]|uniref:MBL fold metallo-hydrolase n=1 Tax=Herbivorax sp. ANBcel31 TaxID=3069754 RepID=UPI0027B25789|nr:MBL fold metallo-hydrolase [Herbivorax sp. ANBcel31]MDQ2086633.1 MBL fold metallo-hydrolase [Herbivorax sp. ANBcel31]